MIGQTTNETQHLRPFAAQLYQWGANVTLIKRGAKRPAHKWKRLQHRRQTEAEFARLPWEGYTAKSGEQVTIGGVGIVNGSGGFRTFDIDAPKDGAGYAKYAVPEGVLHAALEAMGLPRDYQWSGRSGGLTRDGENAGWRIVIRCEEELPAGYLSESDEAGVYKAPSKEGLGFGHVELRWGSGQTIMEGEHPTGGRYKWQADPRPTEPPTLVESGRVLAGVFAIARQEPNENTATQPKAADTQTVAASDVSPALLEAKKEALLANVRNAPDGMKYYTLRDISRTFGGYVGGGYYSEHDARRWLRAEIEARRDTVKSMGQAYDTIDEGLAHGKSEPLHFERYGRGNAPTAGVLTQRPHGANGQGPAAPSAPEGSAQPVTLGERLPEADLKLLKECYYREELGDGELFAKLYPRRLVFDHSEGDWHLWAGHYWRPDRTQQVKLLFSGQVAAQYLTGAATLTKQASEAKAAGDDERAESLTSLAGNMMQRARTLRRVTRMKHALEYAAALNGVTGDVWDTWALLLPVENGVVDLGSGELQPGEPEDFMRRHAPTEWKGIDEPCPRWEQFILEIMGGDENMAAYLQRLLGYGVSGLTREHVFPIFWGAKGRNGKDTMLETLGHVLGQLAQPVTKDAVIDSGGWRSAGAPEPHIYDLKGKRLVWTSEAKEGERLDAALVKLITGGGQLKARPPYGQLVEWEPTHLVILVTNPRPHAPADDRALWARIHLVPFEERFIDDPDPANEHEHKVDKRMKEKLQAEASGILAWLVRGFLEWQRSGLRAPAKVQQATAGYRQAEDTLGQFIDECCIVGEGKEARAGQLVNAYFAWCKEMGIKNPMDGRTFGEKMGQRFEKEHKDYGNIYHGIGLLWQPPEERE